MKNNDFKDIRYLIFDLGGVLLNIKPELALQQFAILGGLSEQQLQEKLQNSSLFHDYETGSISSEQFRDTICSILGRKVTNAEIDKAWNSLLLDFPAHKVDLLISLAANYRIFLLSNTNQIHYEHYTQVFSEHHNLSFSSLFNHEFLSFKMGVSKPDPAIYQMVINSGGLNPAECLFFDDTLINIPPAQAAGIACVHINKETDVTDCFAHGRLIRK